MKQNETMTLIVEVDEWDDYFESLKVQLEEEYESLVEKRNSLNADSYEAEELQI